MLYKPASAADYLEIALGSCGSQEMAENYLEQALNLPLRVGEEKTMAQLLEALGSSVAPPHVAEKVR